MKLHAAAILAILCLSIFTVHTVEGSAGSQSMRKYSCVNLSSRQLRIQNLARYEKHPQANAVMFITKKGIRICVGAYQEWVKNAMKNIDQKTTTKGK